MSPWAVETCSFLRSFKLIHTTQVFGLTQVQQLAAEQYLYLLFLYYFMSA